VVDNDRNERQRRETTIRPTDEELMASFQQGDMYAFDQIVSRYKDPLINFVYHFLGSRIDAEDVLQETFLRVYRNRHLYRNIAKFSTWIYTIAGNLAKTELRHRRRSRLLHLGHIGYDNKDYDIPDMEQSPERIVEGGIKQKSIQKEIDSLPVKFREVIILRDVQDLPYEQISEILHVPIGTVKSRVNRARIRLQKHLKYLLEP
jgi:RNA polymerase sigma-70 factor (ECF subfamily)